MKRMACVIALATGTSIVLGATAAPALADKTSALAGNLQLAIASPGTTNGDSTINLDVTFQGGNIRSIELYVDGALIKKQVIRTRDSRGVISFALDGLTVGDHDVLIKAFDQDGNSATASSKVKIEPDVMDTLARWAYPKKDDKVQGVVPIQIQVDRSVRNPYVTFLIDNDFLAFINLPPFTYNWDTTRLPNGSHTIGVEVYDGETLARVKTLTMKVNVINPGGLTTHQQETPDLTKNGKGGPLTNGILETARIAAPKGELTLQAQNANLYRIGSELVSVPRNLVTSPNSRNSARSSAMSSVPNPLNLTPSASANQLVRTVGSDTSTRPALPKGANATAFAKPTPPSQETRVVVVPGLPAVFVQPKDLGAQLTSDQNLENMVHVALRSQRAGNIAAMPSTQLRGSRAITAGAVPVKVSNLRPAAVPKVMAGEVGPRVKSFSVAFDNQRIAFDVAPRVENGLPLAPFRQIFEHTGGKVEWFQLSKTVRAINSEKEIEFRVGQKEATVNNQPLAMEANPYIERGRAIVPLSFVRDALNVKVHFDAATGRVVIESNK